MAGKPAGQAARAPFRAGQGAAVRATRPLNVNCCWDGELGYQPPDGIDWTWIVRDRLEDGDESAHSIELVFEPDGCVSTGGWVSIEWPLVEVQALGRAIHLEPADIPLVLRGAGHSDC